MILHILASILCLVILIYANNIGHNEVNQMKYIKLWNIEKDLIENMNEYANLMQQKIDIINLALSKLRLDHSVESEDPEAFLSNPLNSFALMRRMHLDWNKYHEYMKEPIGKDKINFLEKLQDDLPNADDFRKAQKDFYQIQEAFRIDEIDMANGLLNGKHYNAKLSVLECYAMGKFLDEEKLYEKALRWFQVAAKSYNESYSRVYDIMGLNVADIWFMIAKKLAYLRESTEAIYAMNRAIELRPNDKTFISFKTLLIEVLEFRRICKDGHLYLPTGKHLHCRYNGTNHPFLRLGPFKTEEVSLDPYMVIYHDYVNDNEIKQLKEISLPLIRRGSVGDGKNEVLLPFNFASLNDSKHDLITRLSRRNADITGLSLEYAELIVISYGIGGSQHSHCDHRDDTKERPPPILAGSRHAVVSIYLQDIVGSGALIFPQLNMSIPSKKGIALVFPILNNEGKGETRTQHGSCPIVVGSKWTLVQAFATHAQMFKLPCYK